MSSTHTLNRNARPKPAYGALSRHQRRFHGQPYSADPAELGWIVLDGAKPALFHLMRHRAVAGTHLYFGVLARRDAANDIDSPWTAQPYILSGALTLEGSIQVGTDALRLSYASLPQLSWGVENVYDLISREIDAAMASLTGATAWIAAEAS